MANESDSYGHDTLRRAADIAGLKADMRNLTETCRRVENTLATLSENLDQHFVTKVEFEAKFWPVRAVAIGIVTVFMLAVLGAIANSVIK
jgi:hypothetical protein